MNAAGERDAAAGAGTPARRVRAQPVGSLLDVRRLTAVCAHPDDESFGLGGVIAACTDHGARVDLVCLTRGEASTLGDPTDLAARRGRELRCAADQLGLARVALLDLPDGGLAEVPLDRLAEAVATAARDTDGFLVFDDDGVTGHRDHQRATAAALAVAVRLEVPVFAWVLPAPVAEQLNREFGTSFTGRGEEGLHERLLVDRRRQLAAMGCHGSQLGDNPVPRRRLELQGSLEHVRRLDPAAGGPGRSPARG